MNITVRRKLEIAIVAYLKRFRGVGEPLNGVEILEAKEQREDNFTKRVIVFASNEEPEVEGHWEIGVHKSTLKVMVLTQADDETEDIDDSRGAAVQGILFDEESVQQFCNYGSNRPVDDFRLTRLAYLGSDVVNEGRTWGEELQFEAIYCDYN